MRIQTILALIITYLMISLGAASAQTPPPVAPAAPVTEPAAAPVVDPATPPVDLDAAPVPEEPQFTTEVFGDWEKRCSLDGSECFLYQIIQDTEGNPIMEFSIIALPEGAEAAAGATAVTPLGTLLPAGLVLKIDSGGPIQYPYNWCTRAGCFARFGFRAAEVEALKRGSKATFTLSAVAAAETPIVLNVSLTGFTAAFNSLSK